MTNIEAFHEAVKHTKSAAIDGYCDIGIVPRNLKPAMLYSPEKIKEAVFCVDEFVEKPDEATARRYLKDGNYYWNSGMFLFKAKAYLDELAQFEPEMLDSCQKALAEGKKDLVFFRIDPEAFASCPANSIDYAVMEKTKKAVVVPLDAGWSDIGSWASLLEICDKDESGNNIKGDVAALDVKNSLIRSEIASLQFLESRKSHHKAETKDAVMVVHKDRVKTLNLYSNVSASLVEMST